MLCYTVNSNNNNKMHKLKNQKRFLPSPIPQVSQINSTSFQTNATHSHLDVFNCLTFKRKSYAFQLFKQFILFSDSQSQSQIQSQDNKQIQQDLQNAFDILVLFSQRAKQKLKLIVFDRLKTKYIKHKLVYRNKKYLTKIFNSITNLIKDQHHQILEYVFLQLIHNLKVSKAYQLNMKNSASSSFPKFVQFQDKNFKAKHFMMQSSFNLDSNQHSKIFGTHQDLFFQSDSRIQIANDLNIRKELKTMQLKNSKYNDKTLIKNSTPKRQMSSEIVQQIFIIKNNNVAVSNLSNQKRFKRSSSNYSSSQKGQRSHRQNNYVEREQRDKQKNYIKIPIVTENINIVELNTNKYNNQGMTSQRKSKRDHASRLNYNADDEMQIEHTQGDCGDCKYCINKKSLTNAQAVLKTARQRLKYRDIPVKVTITQFSY